VRIVDVAAAISIDAAAIIVVCQFFCLVSKHVGCATITSTGIRESGVSRYSLGAGCIVDPGCNLGYRVNGVISNIICGDLLIIEGVRGQAVMGQEVRALAQLCFSFKKLSEKGVKDRCIRGKFAHLESFHAKGGGLTGMVMAVVVVLRRLGKNFRGSVGRGINFYIVMWTRGHSVTICCSVYFTTRLKTNWAVGGVVVTRNTQCETKVKVKIILLLVVMMLR
jgi:hypothetical protein